MATRKKARGEPKLSFTVKLFIIIAIILGFLVVSGSPEQTAQFFAAIGGQVQQPGLFGGPPPVPGITIANINNCQELNQSGVNYRLTADIDARNLPKDKACFNITNSSIIFDCQGHTLLGPYYPNSGVDPSGTTSAFFLQGNRQFNTIQNCDVRNFGHGVFMAVGEEPSGTGVELHGPKNNQIINNNFADNGFSVAVTGATTACDTNDPRGNIVINNNFFSTQNFYRHTGSITPANCPSYSGYNNNCWDDYSAGDPIPYGTFGQNKKATITPDSAADFNPRICAGADLIVSRIDFDTLTLRVGDTAGANITYCNVGNAPADNGGIILVDTRDFTENLGGVSGTSGPIQPGQCLQTKHEWLLSIPGLHNYGAFVDSDFTVTEINEFNNGLNVTFTVSSGLATTRFAYHNFSDPGPFANRNIWIQDAEDDGTPVGPSWQATIIRNISDTNFQNRQPALSHNAQSLAFETFTTNPATKGIYLMDLSCPEAQGGCPLSQQILPGDAFAPEFSPDDTKILYFNNTDQGIWTYDIASGTSSLALGGQTPRIRFGDVTWTNQGNNINFVKEFSDIFTIPATCGGTCSPTDISVSGIAVRGSQGLLTDIAFNSGTNLSVTPYDGGTPRTVIGNTAGPVWSPDGNWIAYYNASAPSVQIYRVNTACINGIGCDVKQLINVGVGGEPFDWQRISMNVTLAETTIGLATLDSQTFGTGGNAWTITMENAGHIPPSSCPAGGARVLINSNRYIIQPNTPTIIDGVTVELLETAFSRQSDFTCAVNTSLPSTICSYRGINYNTTITVNSCPSGPVRLDIFDPNWGYGITVPSMLLFDWADLGDGTYVHINGIPCSVPIVSLDFDTEPPLRYGIFDLKNLPGPATIGAGLLRDLEPPFGLREGQTFTYGGHTIKLVNTAANVCSGNEAAVFEIDGFTQIILGCETYGTLEICMQLKYPDDNVGVYNSSVSNDGLGYAIFNATVSLAGLPDLYIENLTIVPGAPRVGDIVNVTSTYCNRGTAAAGATDTLVIDDTEVFGNLFSQIPLAPGACNTAQLTVQMTIPGLHTVRTVTDDAGDIPESDETNNQLSYTFNVGTLAPQCSQITNREECINSNCNYITAPTRTYCSSTIP